MKKITKFTLALVAVVIALAGLNAFGKVLSRTTFSITGSAGGTGIIPVASGTPICESLNTSVATGATVVIHRADRKTTANNPVTAGTSIVVRAQTGTTGMIGGAVPTTSDYLFVATTASGYVFRAITSVVNSTNTVSLGFATAITVATNDPAWIAIAANQYPIVLGTTARIGDQNMFAGFDQNPVAVVVPSSAGATTVSGTIKYDDMR